MIETMIKHFRGCATALVTPMLEDGSLDEESYRQLIQWQISEKIDGLVPAGTTGESPTLSHHEHDRVIKVCIEESAGRVPVFAGTGSNSTEEACRLSRHAEKQGADALLIVTPYYNKPSQDGLYQHFAKIAASVSLPIFIYNIPGRCIVNMSVETMVRLANDFTNIVGVKDVDTANLQRVTSIRRSLGDNFIQLSGEDATIAGFLGQGGHGMISVSSNVFPRSFHDLCHAWFQQDFESFARLRDLLLPISEVLFCQPNPAPVKYALSLMERCSAMTRLPMIPCPKESQALISNTLNETLKAMDMHVTGV